MNALGMRAATLVCACCLAVPALAAAAPKARREGVTKKIDPPKLGRNFAVIRDDVLWERRISQLDAEHVRVGFSEIVSPAGLAYELVIRRGDGKDPASELARYPASEFGAARTFLTDVLFQNDVTVQVVGSTPLAGLSFNLDRVVYKPTLETGAQTLSLLPIWRTLAEAKRDIPSMPLDQLAASVAKLHIGEGFVCSGFLISPSSLLTNHHCVIESRKFRDSEKAATRDCSDIGVQFDFDDPAPPQATPPRCLSVRDSNASLDYAVLQVDPKAISLSGKPRPSLSLSSAAPAAQDWVLIIHHPGGLSKKFSYGCSGIPSGKQDLVEHNCSTIGGSSGSPIVARDGTVVGLHYAGAFDEDINCADVVDAIKNGLVLLNKGKAMALLRARLKPFLSSQ